MIEVLLSRKHFKMKNFLHLLFSILLVGLGGQIHAQCDFDTCPEELFIDVMDQACDETTGEIFNITGYDYDDAGTGGIISQSDFLAMPGNPAVNGDCDDTEMYGYVDGPIEFSSDCQGDGYYSWFERTWEIYDAGGTVISTCVQFIRLVDMFSPFENIDLVAFFEDQDPDGNGWTITSNDCPVNLTWIEPTPGDFEDNCSPGNGITVITSVPPGSDFGQGPTTVTYTFMDECGNDLRVDWDVEVQCITCMGAPVFENCTDPPIECDLNTINGFMSCTPDYNGVPGGPMCNGQGTIHNPSYFSFVAGSEDISITIGVSDCVANGGFIGVQANVTDPCDENTCYGDSGAACFDNQFNFDATGLTIGNVYQLLVDGCNGSECAYSVTIDSAPPFEIPDPEAPEAMVETPSTCDIDVNNIVVCPGTVVTFNPENFVDAEFFFCWTLDDPSAAVAQNNDTDCTTALVGTSFSCSSDYSTCGPLELEFTTVGTFQLCLEEMDNGCDNNSPSNYCYDIEVVEAVDVDFGVFEICESQVAFFTPPPADATGEQWQGPTGVNLDVGANVHPVDDDCGCDYNQLVEIMILPQEPTTVEQVEWCANDLTSWVDPQFPEIDWEFIQSFVAAGNPLLFEEVFIEGGSDQIDWEGMNCTVFKTYEFLSYDIPGTIVQTAGSACDATLCFEIDAATFPGFMNEDDIQFTWTDAAGTTVGNENCVSVSVAGLYTVNMEYLITSTSANCMFSLSEMADLSGSAPGMPAFTANPTSTCASQATGLIYEVVDSGTSTFDWTVTNGTITSGQGTNGIMVDVLDTSMPMTVSVIAETPGCGTSPAATATLTVTPDPVVTLGAVQDVCVGQMANLEAIVTVGTAAMYEWTVDDGTATFPGVNNTLSTLPVTWNNPGMQGYSVSIMDAAGCVSGTVSGMVNVIAPLEMPTGSCTVENSNSVTIEWTDAPGQTTIVTPSMPGTQNGNTFTVGGLSSGQMVTFTLVTDGTGNPCGDSAPLTLNCQASNCTVNPTVSSPMNDICQNGMTAPFALAGSPMGGTWSGPGVDPVTGMFDPAAADVGVNMISYEVFDAVQDCSGTGMVSIQVFEDVDATFTLSSDVVCIGELVTINYTPNGAGEVWTFDAGANAQSNILPNQFDISYLTAGDKMITLSLTNGSCSMDFELPLTVLPALPAPIITCTPTPISVDFSWDAIPGVTEYILEVTTNGTTNTSTQSTTVLPVDGLTAGDDVTIVVTAVDPNGCNNSSTTNLCTAQNCPTYTVNLMPDPVLGTSTCWDPAAMITFDLTAMVTDDTGATAAGMGGWSGPDGIDPITGNFTPIGPGSYTIVYNFSDATNCPGIGTIDIEVLDDVSSAFSTDVNELCLGETLTLEYDGTYNGTFDYQWAIDTDAANFDFTDNLDGTFTVVFTSDPGGSVDLSLLVDAGDCQSPETNFSVDVITPLDFAINNISECYSIDDSIELGPFDGNGDVIPGSWVIIDGGPLPGSTFDPAAVDSMYTLMFTEANCGESDMIEVEIIAAPDLSIGPLSQTICITDNNATINISSQFFDEVMHIGDQPPLPTLTGSMGGDFDLDYSTLGPGTYTYTSVIDKPGDCDSPEITWEVIVEDEPEMPVISCAAQTLNSVTFEWTQVPCAESYSVILMGPDGEVLVGDIGDDTEYTVEDLDQGDEVEISVAIISSCECVFADALTTTCNAMDCEPATITIGDELDVEYCVSDLPSGFMLTADVAGIDIDNSGTFTYSGTGISADGMVDLSGVAAGDYTITVLYEEDGCDYTEDISYSILEAPGLVFDIESAPCADSTEGTVTITATGEAPFVIESSQALSEGENTLLIGDYTVMVTDANGCTYSETITVGQAAVPVVDLGVPDFGFTEQVANFNVDLDGASIDSVSWSIDGLAVDGGCTEVPCLNYEFTPQEIRFYTICAEVFYGDCMVTDCREMEADELQINSLYVPNIFDPNDPLNIENSILQMYVEGYDVVIKDISIYDRWGNRVHFDDDEKVGMDESVIELWDGTFMDGRQYIPGVYIYVMEMELNGFTEFMTGDVTLID